MARPNLTSLFSKFLFRETLTSEEKGYIRSDIGAETAGAAATAQALAISTASGDAMTKANAAQAAAIAASQPLDSDLTAFASGASAAALGDATAQANRRGMTGSAKKASTITARIPSYRHAQSGAIGMGYTQGVGNFVSGDELEVDGIALAFGTEITIGGSFAASVANLIEAIQANTICIAYFNSSTHELVLMAQASGISANGAIWIANFDAEGATQTGTLGSGSATYTTTTPTEIGESIFTYHSDGTVTEWSATNTSPAAWIPRTAGIIQHANGDWYRQTLAADGTAEYELLPNQ
jgi:hypothetical protein